MNEHYVLENKRLLKVMPFYNVLIDFVKSDAVQKFNNVKLLSELPFDKDLSVREISEAFKRYAKSFRVEIVDRKDPMIQLYLSRRRISKLFLKLLEEMIGFKYQITLFVTLKKHKLDGTVEYVSVYLNLLLRRLLMMVLMRVLIKVLVKFCLSLIIGLMKDLDGLLRW